MVNFGVLGSLIRGKLILVFAVTSAIGFNVYADSSELLVQLGDCVENCGDEQAAITISSFGLGGSVQGYSAIKTSINDVGQTIFSAVVQGSGVTTGINRFRILRREVNGDLTVLAKPGTPVVGIPGATLQTGASAFVPSTYKALFNDGSVLLDTYILIPGTSGARGYVCLTGGQAIALLISGEAVPDYPGATFVHDAISPYPHLSSSQCSTVVRAKARVGTVDTAGLWEVKAGQSPRLIGRRYAQAPGLPPGVMFGHDIVRPSYANQNYTRVEYKHELSGYSLVQSYLEGDGVRRDPSVDALPLNNTALWLRSPSGAMSLVVRSGDAVPDMPGVYFDQLAARLYWGGSPGVAGYIQMQAATVTSDGKYAFRAQLNDLSGDPYSTLSGTSIWSNRTGALRMETKTGRRFTDPMSGQEWEIATLVLPNQNQAGVYLHENGTLYYSGSGYRVGIDPLGITNPARKFLIEHQLNGSMKVIAYEGQSVPNRSDLRLTEDITSNFFVNRRPSVMFYSNTIPTSPFSSNARTIMMYRDGVLASSARTGDQVDALGGLTLDPNTLYSVFPSGTLGHYTWKLGGGALGFVIGNDSGGLKFIVDNLGHLPSSGDSRLTSMSHTCVNLDTNQLDDILMSCNVGSLSRLVAYHPDGEASQCLADFNSDGNATVQDIFDFLTAWFAQDMRADFNHDGSMTVQDLFDFLAAWFEGCH